jgi:opacity protein-like surface antigen
MKKWLLTAVLLSIATPASQAAECVYFGTLSLTGRLVQQTYAGPPDFESVTKGDEPRVIWIVQLDRGLCIISTDASYPNAYGQKEVQLVLGADQYARTALYARYRQLLGQKIRVTGQLQPGGARYDKRFVIVTDAIEPARP